jgi:hypothetical protein
MKTAEDINAILAAQRANDEKLAHRQNTAKMYAEILGHPKKRVIISAGDWQAMKEIAIVVACVAAVVLLAMALSGCGR